MVNSCCAINCTRRYVKGENVKFHRFPKNEVIRKKWIISLKRKDFSPKNRTVLCGGHFLQSDYERNVHGNLVLKKDSVPSVFTFPAYLFHGRNSSRKQLQRNCSENADTAGTASSSQLEEASEISVEPQEITVDSAGTGNLVLIEDSEPSAFKFPAHLFHEKNSSQKQLQRNCSENADIAGTASSSQLVEASVISVEPQEISVDSADTSSDTKDPFVVTTPETHTEVDSCELKFTPSTIKEEFPQKRKRRYPVHFGDFIEEDLESPVKRRDYWKISQNTINEYKTKCKYLHCKMKRREKQIENLNMVIQNLKRQLQLSSAACVP